MELYRSIMNNTFLWWLICAMSYTGKRVVGAKTRKVAMRKPAKYWFWQFFAWRPFAPLGKNTTNSSRKGNAWNVAYFRVAMELQLITFNTFRSMTPGVFVHADGEWRWYVFQLVLANVGHSRSWLTYVFRYTTARIGYRTRYVHHMTHRHYKWVTQLHH